MKKIIPLLLIVAVIIFGLYIRDEKVRAYTDPTGAFSFEYPRELTPVRIGDTVSFSDTPQGPFLISVRTIPTTTARLEACAYTENPDNDPGIQEFSITHGGATILVRSRGVDGEQLRRSFRLSSAFLRTQQAADLR